MKRPVLLLGAMAAVFATMRVASAADTLPATAQTVEKPRVVIFDFSCSDAGENGIQLADGIRLRLARHDDYEMVDQLTTQETTGPVEASAPPSRLRELMFRLGVNVAICGTVSKRGQSINAEVRCLDLRGSAGGREWTRTFSDSTERARGVISRQVVEALTGTAEWKPPEYGEETEPNSFDRPVNVNGDFEQGTLGWDAPDNVSTFLVDGPARRGKVLNIRTDLLRDPWLEYRRKLMFGQADPANPPDIPRSTGYDSVGGLEGVHYCSDWIEAKGGQRYWLTADVKGPSSEGNFPKVFVKGYRDMSAFADGLSELSLNERKFTPDAFAALPPEERKRLIAEDVRLHPDRHRREVYRWYLSCRFAVKNPRPNDSGNPPVSLPSKGDWRHFAAPFPPRGGLPDNVQWLQIQVYAYWPPGEYFFDNVRLYKDPMQTSLLLEERPRTPNLAKENAAASRP